MPLKNNLVHDNDATNFLYQKYHATIDNHDNELYVSLLTVLSEHNFSHIMIIMRTYTMIV